MRVTRSILLASAFLSVATATYGQQINTKKLLEDYSLQLFQENATGYMGPLVIVSNVGANHGFFNSATISKRDEWTFRFSLQTMMAWVRDDQRSYTAYLPLDDRKTDGAEVAVFKQIMRGAVATGELKQTVRSSTVFGSEGENFPIPKDYIRRNFPWIDSATLATLPDEFTLTAGTNKDFVFAGVPQFEIGTWKNTEGLIRYIPPIEYDTTIGKFSFFGIALRHSISNWLDDPPVELAAQFGYQYSTLDNFVGATQARLRAWTNMLTFNIHASRRFGWIEPYLGLSIEHLTSKGSYRFTLPKSMVDQIGYDIDPQTAHISLDDTAFKATVGALMSYGKFEGYISAGISKHFILGIGLGYKVISGSE